MALVVRDFQAQNAADLVTAVNAYLATLTNPKINGVWITADEDGRTLGRTYRAMISTQTGGAVIATPWVLTITEGQNSDVVGDAARAYVLANGSAFIAAPRILTWYSDGGSLTSRCAMWLMANATVGASANWLPL